MWEERWRGRRRKERWRMGGMVAASGEKRANNRKGSKVDDGKKA
jgi:hypothetical protein